MRILILFICLVYASITSAQSHKIIGTVLEKETGVIMEYCTVSVFDQSNQLVTGSVTDFDGKFSISIKEKGIYMLKVSFIGFETMEIPNLIIDSKNKTIELGKIYLNADANSVQTVEVTANRATTRYQMDKKVISIDKNIAAEAGTAIDALEAAPSVQVNADGTVLLRGSSNFLVLVNGQPTTLSGSEALQQIPAINIKNIEIITNPSAKFNAENDAGILNVILKENQENGTSGLIGLNAGTFNSFGANVNIKHKVKKVTFDFSARIRNRPNPSAVTDSLYTNASNAFITKTEGETSRIFGGSNFNYAMSYDIKKGHKIQADIVYGRWFINSYDNRTLNREQSINSDLESFQTQINTTRGSPYFGPSLSYYGTFKNKHKLSSYIGYSQRDFSEEVLSDNFSLNDELLGGTKTMEKADNRRITSKIDYTIPIKEAKFEFGVQTNNVFSRTQGRAFDFNVNNEIFEETVYNNANVDFERSVYGIYATFGNVYKKLNYSVGLRSEFTDRRLNADDGEFIFSRWNFFPSLHLAYNFDDLHQIYASYSSRINRPRSWQIVPQIIQTSANSFFQGDQDIEPNIINKAEIGWAKSFEKSTRLSAEVYYSLSQDYRQFIRVAFTEGTTITRPENVGELHNIGLEINIGQDLSKWWNIELNGASYLSVLKISDEIFGTDRSIFQWNARLNNYFELSKTTKIQLTANYRSKQLTAQGFQGDRFHLDLGLKQSFLKRSLNLSLNARNILNTLKDNGEIVEESFYYSYFNKPDWPRIELALNYKINNYKQSRKAVNSSQGQI